MFTSNHIRRISAVVLLGGTIGALSAQGIIDALGTANVRGVTIVPGFANKYMSELMVKLEPSGISTSFRGDTIISGLSKRPISVRTNSRGEVDFIGVNVFNDAIVSADNKVAIRFVERFMLETLLEPNNSVLMDYMKLYRINVFSETFTGTTRQVIAKAVEAIDDNTSLTIENTAVTYAVNCMKDGKSILSISFPSDYELMTGQTKVEAEESLYDNLIAWCTTPGYVPGKVEIEELTKPSEGKYYTTNDGTYLNLKELRSVSYYKVKRHEATPVFDEDAYIESVYNLFNTDHDFGVTVSITQDMYYGKCQFDIPMCQFVQFLCSQGCVFYTGIKSFKPGVFECSVYAVNAKLGYHHQFIVTVPTKIFSDSASEKVTARMYSYVPIHNQEAGFSL